MAWTRTSILLSLVVAAALAPQAAACTSTSGPYQSVRFVATEDGQTLLDLPTSIRVGPNGLCGYDGPPALHFDGRYAAWSTFHSLHVVDVEEGTERDYLPGVLTDRHLALLPTDGWRPNVTLLDLDAAASQVVAAPADESFVANFRGAVVALGAVGDQTALSVLDPVSGAWLLRGHVVETVATVTAASGDWVVFGEDDEAQLVDVTTGATTTLAANGDVVGVHGDRLYLRKVGAWTSSGSPPSVQTWSVGLPAGDDRQDGAVPPEQHAAAGRSVAFVVQATGTQGPSGTQTGGTTGAAFTPEPSRGASTTTASSPAGPDGVVDVPAWPWAAAAAVAAALLVRRRL